MRLTRLSFHRVGHWLELAPIALGPRVVRPAWVSARSISAALSSLLPLNSASLTKSIDQIWCKPTPSGRSSRRRASFSSTF